MTHAPKQTPHPRSTQKTAAPYPYASRAPPSARPTPRIRCPSPAPPQSAPPSRPSSPPSPTNTQTENPPPASRSPSPTRYPPSPASTQTDPSPLRIHLSSSAHAAIWVHVRAQHCCAPGPQELYPCRHLVFPSQSRKISSQSFREAQNERKEPRGTQTARDRRLSIALHPSTQIAGTR